MIMHFSEMFDKPIFITETGYCTSPSQELDGNDQHRIDYIKDTLKSVKEALDAGADILGCIYWSIFDNFELALGKNYKYGLIEVDSNQNRSPKESARFYQSLINSKNREGLLSEH
jgi:6-phospho-beta-glucosidase